MCALWKKASSKMMSRTMRVSLLLVALGGLNLFVLHSQLSANSDDEASRNQAHREKDAGEEEELALRNAEWEQLSRYDHFRRSAAYYLADKRLVRVYFFTTNASDFTATTYRGQLVVSSGQSGRKYELALENASVVYHDGRYQYSFVSLNFERLDVLDRLRRVHGVRIARDQLFASSSVKLKLGLFVEDVRRGLRTRNAIELKVRGAERRQGRAKRGSVACTYCYFYGASDTTENYMEFVWWIELHKQLGYERLLICNHSFPHTPRYERLFARHAGFVRLYHMKFLPNYLNDTSQQLDTRHDYLRSFSLVHPHITIPFEALIYNECYMDHFDTYEYVAVNGADELIIPRTVAKLARDSHAYALLSSLNLTGVRDKRTLNALLDIESQCSSSPSTPSPPIDTYLKSVERALSNNSNSRRQTETERFNFYFKMGHYLRDASAHLIFNRLVRYFASARYRHTARYSPHDAEHWVTAVDPTYNNFTYRVVMRGERDVAYAKNMIKIYRLLVADFKRDHELTLAPYNNQFDRFVYLAGGATWFLCGKTVYNTERSLAVSVHFPDRNEIVNGTFNLRLVDYEYGLDSHFRRQYSLEDKHVEIRDIKLDLNYLYCYYRPALKAIADIDIINV